jgi:hypothetical protein
MVTVSLARASDRYTKWHRLSLRGTASPSSSRMSAGAHITEEHSELAGLLLEVLETIAHPKAVYAGGAGELPAVREMELGK